MRWGMDPTWLLPPAIRFAGSPRLTESPGARKIRCGVTRKKRTRAMAMKDFTQRRKDAKEARSRKKWMRNLCDGQSLSR